MAEALRYCDLFLPGHSLTGLHQLLLALASDHAADVVSRASRRSAGRR
jgi:uncharacterized protein with von Willebrand factor type A (vWA) domain